MYKNQVDKWPDEKQTSFWLFIVTLSLLCQTGLNTEVTLLSIIIFKHFHLNSFPLWCSFTHSTLLSCFHSCSVSFLLQFNFSHLQAKRHCHSLLLEVQENSQKEEEHVCPSSQLSIPFTRGILGWCFTHSQPP